MVKITSFKKDVKILENLPQVLTELDEVKAIANVEDVIITSTWSLLDQAIDNQFVNSADVAGLSRYERMLQLKISDTDTIETRVFRILSRFQENAPYTWRDLNKLLGNLLGFDNFILERDVVAKSLTVNLELTVERQFDILVDLLERVVPANMTIDVKLRYNTHVYLSQFRHSQLKNYTHTQLREDKLNPPPYVPPPPLNTLIHNDLTDKTNYVLREYEYE